MVTGRAVMRCAKPAADLLEAVQVRAVGPDAAREILVDPQDHQGVEVRVGDRLVVGVQRVGGGFEEAGKTWHRVYLSRKARYYKAAAERPPSQVPQ